MRHLISFISNFHFKDKRIIDSLLPPLKSIATESETVCSGTYFCDLSFLRDIPSDHGIRTALVIVDTFPPIQFEKLRCGITITHQCVIPTKH